MRSRHVIFFFRPKMFSSTHPRFSTFQRPSFTFFAPLSSSIVFYSTLRHFKKKKKITKGRKNQFKKLLEMEALLVCDKPKTLTHTHLETHFALKTKSVFQTIRAKRKQLFTERKKTNRKLFSLLFSKFFDCLICKSWLIWSTPFTWLDRRKKTTFFKTKCYSFSCFWSRSLDICQVEKHLTWTKQLSFSVDFLNN